MGVVAVLVAARIALAVAAWEPGWSALTWDDFTRVAIAQDWAAHPQFATSDLVWLPFSTWVNGAAFAMFGDLVIGNPMLLTAIVNTVAYLLTAGLVGWSALRLSGSQVGGLVAFVVALFAPWGLFASLSGMSEPLYYLTVAAVVRCTIGWLQTKRRGWLVAATLAVAIAAASRYEGWTLMAAWMLVLAYLEVAPIEAGLLGRVRKSIGNLAIMAVPAVVPLWWIALNWLETGNPLNFAAEVAHYFANSYGAVHGIIGRLTYYPLPLVRAAPLVVLAIAAIFVARRRDRLVVSLTVIVALHFGMLYFSSLVSPVVGAAAIERFLFALVVSLMPFLGFLPDLIGRFRAPRLAAVILVAVFLVVTVIRTQDRPLEWTHGPDLLELAATLGDLGTSEEPLSIVVGPGFEDDVFPLSVRNGDRVRVNVAPGLAATGPELGARTVWIEKWSEQVSGIASELAATIGRYRVYADFEIPVQVCVGCDAWRFADEFGSERDVGGGPYVAVEFTAADPPAGSRASVSHEVARSAIRQVAVLEMRALYGHGFNPGRIQMQVDVDGTVVFSRDIADRSRWTRVTVPIDPGEGMARISVSVVAMAGIETGWDWGGASTVLVRSLEVAAE